MRILALIFSGLLLMTSSPEACYLCCFGGEDWAEENRTEKEQFHFAAHEIRNNLIEGGEDFGDEEGFFLGNAPASCHNSDSKLIYQPQIIKSQEDLTNWQWWKS